MRTSNLLQETSMWIGRRVGGHTGAAAGPVCAQSQGAFGGGFDGAEKSGNLSSAPGHNFVRFDENPFAYN
jgi:hypothetical protein